MFPPQNHIEAAQASGDSWYEKTKVYSFPSFRLAQTGIESANGAAVSGKNNYWGVKANKAQIAAGEYVLCWTHEVINGQTIRIQDKFASYPSLEEGYMKQAELLVTSKLYEKSRHANNPKQYAIDVGHIYATAPNYTKVVIDYMERNNLYQYDNYEHRDSYEKALKPPAHLEKKAQGPIVAGAVVAGASTAASSVSHHVSTFPTPTFMFIALAGLIVTTVCVAIGIWKYRHAHKALADILKPPTEAQKAEVLAQVAAKRVQPIEPVEVAPVVPKSPVAAVN